MTKSKGEVASYAPNLAHVVSAAARALGASLLPATVLAGLAVGPASAADRYWDGATVNGGNPAANANGGAGTWNNTLTNWDTAARPARMRPGPAATMPFQRHEWRIVTIDPRGGHGAHCQLQQQLHTARRHADPDGRRGRI